jgi:hypothetical protein
LRLTTRNRRVAEGRRPGQRGRNGCSPLTDVAAACSQTDLPEFPRRSSPSGLLLFRFTPRTALVSELLSLLLPQLHEKGGLESNEQRSLTAACGLSVAVSCSCSLADECCPSFQSSQPRQRCILHRPSGCWKLPMSVQAGQIRCGSLRVPCTSARMRPSCESTPSASSAPVVVTGRFGEGSRGAD